MMVFMGFHKSGYNNSWLADVMENPNLKWMMTGGTPMTQETTKYIGLDYGDKQGAW